MKSERTPTPAPIDFERKLDDIQSDIGHLGHLLDVTLRQLEDIPTVRQDGTRIAEMYCVHALMWIARDMSEKVAIDMEDAAKSRISAKLTAGG